MTTNRSCFVLGASGGVGRKLVNALIESKDYSKVLLLGRRVVDDLPKHEKIQQKVVDFDKIENYADEFKGLDVGFSTLGTTRAQEDKAGYYKIDHDYVVNTAKVAKEQGVKEFVVVTAAGANEKSWFFYPRLKGEIERDVAAVGFDKCLIMHPGFIEKRDLDFRRAEWFASIVAIPVKCITNSAVVSAEAIAKAMIVGTLDSSLKGKVILSNATMIEMAKKFSP